MPLHSVPQFIMVRCQCGRTLRAKWDQVGTDIQCWDCQAMVPIAVPKEQSRLLGAIGHAIGDLFRGPGGSRIVAGTFVLSVALMVPLVGLVLAGLLMAAGGIIYVAQVRADDPADLDRDSALLGALRRPSPGRVVVGLGLTLGTILPLWLFGIGDRRSPHLNGLGLTLFLLTWSIGPIASVFHVRPSADDEPEPGVRWAEHFGPLRLHPFATLAVLLIVPLGLVVCEAMLGGLFYLSRSLSLLVLDYMPRSGDLFYYRGYAFDGAVNYNDLPDVRFLADYGRGLRRGYTFVGAIPPSFTAPSRLGVETDSTLWNPTLYFLVRVGAILLTSLCLILSCAVQARCLNVLAHARSRRLA